MQPAPEHETDTLPIADERELLAALRDFDEVAFAGFVDAHHGALVRFAATYVHDQAAAEEVAQDAWAAFLTSLPRFEGRCRLKTWLFRTLLNCARSRKRKDVRLVPLATLFDPGDEAEPSVDAGRFVTGGVWAGGWSAPPRSFGEDGERSLLAGELRLQLRAALALLPPAQREVVTLRDVEGFAASEVCDLLGLSEPNQRVLLHRGRARLRAAIECYVEERQGAA